MDNDWIDWIAVGKSLRKLREDNYKTLSWAANELKVRLNRKEKHADSTISNWETGVSHVPWHILPVFCEIYGCRIEQILGIPKPPTIVTCKGYEWTKGNSQDQNSFQEECVNLASNAFEAVIQGGGYDLINEHGSDKLYDAVHVALNSGLQLLDVPLDAERQAQLEAVLNPRPKYVHIVPVAPLVVGSDLLPHRIKTEFVAHAAASKAIGLVYQNQNDHILTGGGYMLLRMAHLSRSAKPSKPINWIPLLAIAEGFGEFPWRQANYIATILSYRHNASDTFHLPFLPEVDRNLRGNLSGEQQAAHKVLTATQRATVAFISLAALDLDLPHSAQGLRSAEKNHYPYIQMELLDQLEANSKKDQFVAEILGGAYGIDGGSLGQHPQVYAPLGVQRLQQMVNHKETVWIVTTGRYKAKAVEMAVRTGIANALVIDSNLADEIIRLAKAR